PALFQSVAAHLANEARGGARLDRGDVVAVVGLALGLEADAQLLGADVGRHRALRAGKDVVAGVGARLGKAAGADGLAGANVLVREGRRGAAAVEADAVAGDDADQARSGG